MNTAPFISQQSPFTRQIFIFENTFSLNNDLLKKWMTLAKYSIAARGMFTVCLSGGKTPVEFFTKLCTMQDFDLWRKTHLFLADERFVDFDHSDNTWSLVQRILLDYVNIPKENLHPVNTEVESVFIAAEEYKNELQQFFKLKAGELPVFDLMLLGIGEDGHTASLFPGISGINDPQRLTMPTAVDYQPHERVSLTLPVINQARHKVLLVQGGNKAEILKKILIDRFDCPASQVNAEAGSLTFLVDKKAAKLLPLTDSNIVHVDQAVQLNIP